MFDMHYDLLSVAYCSYLKKDYSYLEKWCKAYRDNNVRGVVCNLYFMSLDEMIFFGDGLNDLEVIDEVGLGVAMGNALDEIKDKSKEVTETNNNDGIVKFLDRKLNRQKVKKI